MPDKEKNYYDSSKMQFTQDESSYVVQSSTEGNVCANCRWFRADSSYMPCVVVRGKPLPIVSGGWCNQWSAIPERVIDDGMSGIGIESEIEDKIASWKERASHAWKSLFGVDTPSDEAPPAFKQIENGDRWVAFWSNNFRDRHGDIITLDALKDNVSNIRSGEYEMPRLYYDHNPAYEHGISDKAIMIGNFAFASGTYHEDEDKYPFIPVAKALYEGWEDKGIHPKVSHGFSYPVKSYIDGYFHQCRTFEISTLKPTHEANIATIAYPIVNKNKDIGFSHGY